MPFCTLKVSTPQLRLLAQSEVSSPVMLVKSKRFRVYKLFNLPGVVIAQALETRACKIRRNDKGIRWKQFEPLPQEQPSLFSFSILRRRGKEGFKRLK